MARTHPKPRKDRKPAPGSAAAAEHGFPLLTHLDTLVEDLRTHVPKALREWDEEAIHQARVATRRLKAALDLLRPVLDERQRRPFARVLRKLRRQLGPLRDFDVMIGHLKEFRADRRCTAAAEWASADACRLREAERRQFAGQPPARILARLGRWWGLREQVVEARPAVDTLVKESVHLQLDAFVEQADLLVRRHAQAGAPVTAAGRPERTSDKGQTAAANGSATEPAAAAAPVAGTLLDPHELRIAGKALRYTLEMAVKQGYTLPGSVTKTFKHMQESLGLWHDYVVLSDRVLNASIRGMLSHYNPPLQEKVLDLSRATLRKSVRELEKFTALWADRGEELARTIRAAFPLTLPPPSHVARIEAAVPPESPPPAGENQDTANVAAGGEEPAGALEPVSGSQKDPDQHDSAETSAPAPCPPTSASVA